jgi:hypothetical protein
MPRSLLADKDCREMKTLVLMGFLMCVGIAVNPQQSSGTQELPGVVVLKHSWSKVRINWEKDPFGASVEGFEDMRRRISVERRIEAVKPTGEIGETIRLEQAARAERTAKARPPKPPRYAFSYKLLVENVSAKTIDKIDWDYVFFDAATGQELGRRRFSSSEDVGPGSRKEFSLLVVSPPTRNISVYALGKRERDGLNEQIALVRVVYTDGSIWHRP